MACLNTSKEEKSEAPAAGKIDVEIKRGMTSERIAKTLEDAGIVKSASEFDSWLKKNHYSNKLHVGTFSLSPEMSFEEIATELTTKGY